MQVGDIDLTRDDAEVLAANAQRVGVEATVDVWRDMVHGFQGLAAAEIPEAVAALRKVREVIRRAVG